MAAGFVLCSPAFGPVPAWAFSVAHCNAAPLTGALSMAQWPGRLAGGSSGQAAHLCRSAGHFERRAWQ